MNCEGYQLVKEFHLKYGHLVFQGTGVTAEAVRLLRARLIIEELGELWVASHEANPVLVADAVTDLLYVTLGTAVSCTGPIPDVWGTEFNLMSPLRLLAEITNRADMVVRCLAFDSGDLRNHLIVLASGLNGFNLPLRELFHAVHKSNMTKTVVDVQGGKKGSINGPGYQPPDIEGVLNSCFIT